MSHPPQAGSQGVGSLLSLNSWTQHPSASELRAEQVVGRGRHWAGPTAESEGRGEPKRLPPKGWCGEKEDGGQSTSGRGRLRLVIAENFLEAGAGVRVYSFLKSLLSSRKENRLLKSRFLSTRGQ